MRAAQAVILFALCLLPAFPAMAGVPSHLSESFQKSAACGYESYNKGDYRQAISCFKASYGAAPDPRAIAEQIAYAYRKLGENGPAKEWFEKAYDLAPPDSRNRLAREIEALSRPLRLDSYFVYRSSAISESSLATAGSTLTQSQAAIEAAYRPPVIGFRNGRIFEVYTRLIAGLDGNSLDFRPKSTQAGLGVRYKPLSSLNFWVAGERLIKVGDQSGNNWLARASYSWAKGYGVEEKAANWRYITAYFDTALIRPQDPDIFITAETRLGQSYRISGNESTVFVMTPHLFLNGVLENNSGAKTSIVETGPGLGLKLWLPNGAHGAYRSAIDLVIQYRQKLGGNSAGGSGIAVTAALSF